MRFSSAVQNPPDHRGADGRPSTEQIARLRAAGIEVAVTVTSAREAVAAEAAGADSLVLQGIEAGGHRGCFNDDGAEPELALLALLRLIRPTTRLPLIAAGGIAIRSDVAAVLSAGASAAQIGTALMLSPEAGTCAAHRAAFGSVAGTRLTRAFTGRAARGIVNRFIEEHDPDAIRGYPQVHHLTAPLRAAARGRGDASALHLWAGSAYPLAREAHAAEIVLELGHLG